MFFLAFFANPELCAQNNENDSFTLERQWSIPDAIHRIEFYQPETSTNLWYYSPFFVVQNDVVYFSSDRVESSRYPDNLLVIDGSTGEISGMADIDWAGYDHHASYPSRFIGKDSSGNYYLASFGMWQTSSAKADIDFAIYPIVIADGKATVTARYQMPLVKGSYIHNLDITGNIAEGEFSVAAIVWDYRYWDQVTDFRIMVWEKQNQTETVSAPEVYSINGKDATFGDIKILSDNKIALHDRNYIIGGTDNPDPDCEFKQPTIYLLENGKLVKSSQIAATDSGLGAGMAFFNLGDRNMVVYNSGISPFRFCIAELESPDSFDNATEQFAITPYDAGNPWVSDESQKKCSYTPVYVEVPDDESGTANIYMCGYDGSGMAKYTLSAKDKPTTGIENVGVDTDSRPEFYDISGRKLRAVPENGLYIKRVGTSVSKEYRR